MTNNKQQTAVEWLEGQIIKFHYWKRNPEFDEDCFDEIELHKSIQKAKEIEKEQIAKAFDDGDYNYHYSRKTGDDFEDGKEYFNEVYG